jgi:uncharacterized protein (DUF433 family)
MKLSDRITINAEVMSGKSSIRNMRFSVKQMLELLASGMSKEEVLEDYPFLEADDIFACLQYAARLADSDSRHRLSA